MKIYIISKKKTKENWTKNFKYISNACFSVKTMIFYLKNGSNSNSINHVDLIASFLWPSSTPQSEFPIKSYGRLKLRWSNFIFYFFCLSSFLLISFFYVFSVSLISFFIYENRWKGVGNPWDFYFWILIYGSLDWDERTVRWAIRGSKCYWWDKIY
jgi:hypothetical protein